MELVDRSGMACYDRIDADIREATCIKSSHLLQHHWFGVQYLVTRYSRL